MTSGLLKAFPSYFIYILLSLKINATHQKTLRILGGRDSIPGEFPYVVRLEYKIDAIETDKRFSFNTHICTGAVLTPTATLTAAHCCMSELDKTFFLQQIKHAESLMWVIRYGSKSSKPSNDDKFSEVLGYVRPQRHTESYKDTPGRNDDIAILTTQHITLSSYPRISAVDYLTLYGQRASVLGHGMTARKGQMNSTLNLNKPLQVWDGMLWKCDDIIQNVYFPAICVVEVCGDAAMIQPGDSGGPVVHSSGIVGVTSRGRCDYKVKPTNFHCPNLMAPLGPYIDWISDHLTVKI